MKQFLVIFMLLSFVISAQAIDQENIRVVPSKKKVIIEIDGRFPAGPATDVLFVVDDSGSMMEHQKNLSSHITSLVEQITFSNNDFHIGVTSTSGKGSFNGGSQYKLGELIGQHKIIDPKTPDLQSAIEKNLLLGVNGDAIEQLFSPVLAALSEENQNGVNQGFYRPNAHLAVVFLTDTDDQSIFTAWEFVDGLVDLKGSLSRITLQSFMVTSEDIKSNSCRGELKDGSPKIEEAIRLIQGNTYSLCSPQMEQDVLAMAEKIFPPHQGPFLPGIKIDRVKLVGVPEIGSIQVEFGKQKLPEDAEVGWSYDAISGEIIFGDKIVWMPQIKGTMLVVTYRPQD